MTRLTDYGVMLLTHFARGPRREMRTARSLAEASGLPLPTTSKVLKQLARAGLLMAHRGVRGGFSLDRAPRELNVAEIIAALDGPLAITDCSSGGGAPCDIERSCPARRHWHLINDTVQQALTRVTLADMAGAPPAARRAPARARPGQPVSV